jgi:pyridoxal phosphate-dependent aminotransferase EpsN
MSNLLAAVGRGQLRVLQDRVKQRRTNFAYYQKALGDLPGIEFMPELPNACSTRWLTCITVNEQLFGADRETIRLALESENIESRPLWKPMHLQPVFASCRICGGQVSSDLFQRGLCLPSGSNLKESDLCRVVELLRKVPKQRSECNRDV